MKLPKKLSALKGEAARLSKEMRELTGSLATSGNVLQIEQEITLKHAEREMVQAEVGGIRDDIVFMRAQHAAKVKSAMAKPVAAAAARVRDALAGLQVALAALEELSNAAVASHGNALFVLAPDLSGLEGRLARLAGDR